VTRPYKIHSATQADYAIRFTEGKLFFFQAGQSISLTSPIVLRNGIIILTDGTIRFSDGSIKKLGEGETEMFSYPEEE